MNLDTPFPFGKYKGQPLSAVLADRPYLEWALSQVGIREKYPDLLAFMAHGGRATGGVDVLQTPAHNAMQVRFLDEKFRRYVAWAFCCSPIASVSPPKFEYDGWDVAYRFTQVPTPDFGGYEEYLFIELKPQISEDFPHVLRQVSQRVKAAKLRRSWFSPGFHAAVFTDEVTAKSASENQIYAIFDSADVGLITRREIEDIKQEEEVRDLA